MTAFHIFAGVSLVLAGIAVIIVACAIFNCSSRP
jgi:hypothetical protein